MPDHSTLSSDQNPCPTRADDASLRHDTVPTPQIVVIPASGRQTVWWVIALLLAIIATALVDRWDNAGLSRPAMAQQASVAGTIPMGARGIYAFTGQLGPKEYGLFMMDVDSGTIWCYQMGHSRDGELQMQLVAARSWIFDRFLEEFNVAQPTPNEVQIMVRQQRGQAGADNGAAPGATPGQPGLNPTSRPSNVPFAPALPKEENPK
jgi:hypothetical protein